MKIGLGRLVGVKQRHASYKFIGVTLGAAILSACTGGTESSSSADASSDAPQSSSVQQTSSSLANSSAAPQSSSLAQASSSTLAMSSSVSSAMQSSSVQTSSSVPATSQFNDFTANALTGEELYAQQCTLCHGPAGQTGQKIDLTKYPTNSVLHRYIEEYMPKVGPNTSGTADCVGQCAADITAFMDTWRVEDVAACSADQPVLYGERSLKMLTAGEYRNSVQDLFPTMEVPAEHLGTLPDIKIGKFPNHLDTAMIGGRARQFMTNAENIADWAILNNLTPSCATATECADDFIADFGYRAFRRPLTTEGTADENEAAQIRDLFAKAPNTNAGQRWAIIAALTSPNFLYRSEMGVKVSEAIANGWDKAAPGAGNIGDYIADGAGTTVNGANFSTKGSGEASEGFGYNMYTNGTSSHSFNFPNPALVTVTVKANDLDMMWPLMELSVGTEAIASQSVTSYDSVTYTYLVAGQTGNQTLAIAFNNDQGREPYGTKGNDIDLHIGDVTVTAAKLKPGNEPAQSPFELADPDAYALGPFEYAASLSYMYTGSTPDADLLAAAKSGAINDPAEAARQIDRLLASAAAERHVKEFSETWMRIDHMFEPGFTRVGNNFDDSIRTAMIEELRTTFWNVFNDDDVPYSEFFNADYIFANKELADFYGLAHSGNADDFVKINTTERGGITTMGAFLTNWAHQNESAPILRAVNVRELMLCHHIDPPPQTNIAEREQLQKEVDALLSNGEMTTRLYYNLITTHPQCDSCHKEDINPLGGGMEDFNQVGLLRTTQLDKGGNNIVLDINANGTLHGIETFKDYADASDFQGTKALSNILANTDSVQACLSEKFFRQVVSRPIKNSAQDKLLSERELDAAQTQSYSCAHETLNKSLKDNNQSPKAMFKTLGTLDLIRFRR